MVRPARLIALAAVLVVALLALAAAGAAGGSAEHGTAAAKTASKKRCGKRHHKHRRRHGKRRCRGSSGQAGNGAGGAGSGGGSAACSNTAAAPGRVAAKESEYQIVLSRPSVGCRTVILEQDNNGMDPHNLILEKAGDSSQIYTFDDLGPGGVAKKTVDLSRGSWTLYCSLLDHRARGMEVNLTVD